MAVIIALIFSFAIQQQDSSSYRSKAPVVCVDPGHPSEVSSGAEIQNGTSEVHIAWVDGLKLQKLLETWGLKVVMTKSKENELVKNKDRARIANAANAALKERLLCQLQNVLFSALLSFF
jgi:N-acetylmuramoyl-L-alanine amidase